MVNQVQEYDRTVQEIKPYTKNYADGGRLWQFALFDPVGAQNQFRGLLKYDEIQKIHNVADKLRIALSLPDDYNPPVRNYTRALFGEKMRPSWSRKALQTRVYEVIITPQKPISTSLEFVAYIEENAHREIAILNLKKELIPLQKAYEDALSSYNLCLSDFYNNERRYLIDQGAQGLLRAAEHFLRMRAAELDAKIEEIDALARM